MLWTMLLTYNPLMAGIQEISAWLGRVTGMGIAANMMAIPVLAGSVEYAVAELRAWASGLDKLFRSARRFYATTAAVTLLGVALNLAAVNQTKALFWSAVVNGLSAGLIVVLVMLMASNRRLTGKLNWQGRNGLSDGSPLLRCWPSRLACWLPQFAAEEGSRT